jgi:hypothetical protein
MADKLNTHYYDTQLKIQYQELVGKQDKNTDFLTIPWTKAMVFDEIHAALQKQTLTPNSLQRTVNMLNLLQKDDRNNYDPLNNIHTIDILTRTWFFVRTLPKEDQSYFFTQIEEIQDGSCPQGRTTRLFQIYYSFF